jgi:hypothetical protein
MAVGLVSGPNQTAPWVAFPSKKSPETWPEAFIQKHWVWVPGPALTSSMLYLTVMMDDHLDSLKPARRQA